MVHLYAVFPELRNPPSPGHPVHVGTAMGGLCVLWLCALVNEIIVTAARATSILFVVAFIVICL